MANVLSHEKRQMVEGLGRLRWSLRRIQEATGVRRETASEYLKAAGIPVRLPRTRRPPDPKPASRDPNPPVDSAPSVGAVDEGAAGEPKAASREPNPPVDSKPVKVGSGPVSSIEPHREMVEEALGRGRLAVAIYQDLVSDYGYRGAYDAVLRFVRKLRPAKKPEAHPVIQTAPGQEAQVDYGEGPMVRDPATGKYRRTRLFVLTLGYSRKSVRLLVWRSSTQTWCELHEKAFRRLGAAPETVVLDNLREGVLKPDIWDPTLNPQYRDVLAHYGAVALPCRVRHPDRKGKVESAIGHTQRTPLKGQRYETLEEAQAYLDRWETNWADTRIHGTTHRQVRAMFEEERPNLRPLPVEPFRYYSFGNRTVHLDNHVEVDGGYYSAPPGMIGHSVQVQWDNERVRILEAKTWKLLREHAKKKQRGYYQTHDEDRPAKTPATTNAVLMRTARAGKHIGAVAQKIHGAYGQTGVKKMLGLLSLAKKHGAAVVDRACQEAIELGVPDYRFVRRFLERNLGPQLTLRQVDPIIRELTHYRDLINRMTKKGEGK
jgi:transposase